LEWWGSKRALERGECLVVLDALADVLGALVANSVVPKTVRAKQGGTKHFQPLLTTKQALFLLQGSGRALEIGKCIVDLQSLADLLGPLDADAVLLKTARAK